MNLYILRHGIAAEAGAASIHKDSERPLTDEGERKVRKVARAMQALEISLDLLLSSPYLRARQTAEIVADVFHARNKLELSDALTPGGDARTVIRRIAEGEPAPKDVLLVGHEPYLSELISMLLSGNSDLPIVMKKAGLCKLSAESLHHRRCASLEWLLPPKLMTLIG